MNTTVNYGVIKGLEVTLPDVPFNATQMVQAFADAYVRHATNGSLVSDDVLISSIGASHVKEAMIAGVDRYGFAFQDAVKQAAELWSHFVLMARYGIREGTVKDLVRSGMAEAEARHLTASLPE